jgi:outer membrane protein assembly factor BamB
MKPALSVHEPGKRVQSLRACKAAAPWRARGEPTVRGNRRAFGFVALLIGVMAGPSQAADVPAPKSYGWRGNWTGLYPEAQPPLRWGRTPRGLASSLSCQAAKPQAEAARSGQPVKEGLLRDWLIAGPYATADSVKAFDQAGLPAEASLAPVEGDRAGDTAWKRLELTKAPDYERWGTTEFEWLDLGEAVGYKPNEVAYAHTYVFCARPGPVRCVVEHGHGLKIWVNGRECYRNASQQMALGSYVGLSRQRQELTHSVSPHFTVDLGQGWNRLLVKCGAYNQSGSRTLKFVLRLFDAEPVPYEETHVVWKTELPDRSNALPLVVGDRLFVVAEPDELLCLDKRTGKILWRRFHGLADALSDEERKKYPETAAPLADLAARLAAAQDAAAALAARRQMRDLLIKADPAKFQLKWDGHLASHFGIVGFTTTPVSDGTNVFVFYGQGVVAGYDSAGRRKWIKRLPSEEIRYSCSPALSGGRLCVLFNGLHALHPETGAEVWSQTNVSSIASLIPARIRDTDVVFTQKGEVFRAADGHRLWSNPHIRPGDTGWCPPLVLGEMMYLPWFGVGTLILGDFSEVSGGDWKPKLKTLELGADHRRPSGEWLDRWTAASPLVHEGIYYLVDQYGVFYAFDLAGGKLLYKQDTGFDELHHYNAIGVAASPALGGKHIFVLDNQGACLVLEPGRTYKPVSTNRLETLVAQDWPIPPQEIIANGPPAFDGPFLFVRGEKYLYCLGEPAPGRKN